MNAHSKEFSAPTKGFRTRHAVVTLVVLVAFAVMWMVLRPKSDAKATANQDPPPVTLELATADVATVSTQPLTRVLPIAGSLAPLLQTTVKSRVSGELREVSVREGQAVKRGELLARIDDRTLQAQVDSQQAALEKAKADLALAKVNLDHSQALLQHHYISQNAFDTANSNYAAAEASARLQEAQVRQARISLEFSDVRAPFDGVIASRVAQPGENVSPDTPILTMVDLLHMELRAPAPASEIPSVHIGQIANFHVDGFEGRDFSARLVRINPATETGSRSIMMYLAVDNPDSALKSGMFAQGTLALDPSTPRTAIPLAAVHSDTGLPYVYIFANGQLTHRTVELGLQSPEKGLVEVRSGISAGETVVVARLTDIKDGAQAKMADATAPVGSSQSSTQKP